MSRQAKKREINKYNENLILINLVKRGYYISNPLFFTKNKVIEEKIMKNENGSGNIYKIKEKKEILLLN